jgi:hypothetical protein
MSDSQLKFTNVYNSSNAKTCVVELDTSVQTCFAREEDISLKYITATVFRQLDSECFT